VARALRRYGIDVTTTVEAGLRTHSDLAQLEFARHEQRVLVTHDADFLRLAGQVSQHAGIAYGTRAARSLGETTGALHRMGSESNSDLRSLDP
jgi:uncharacterized protein with PIN domain